MYVCTYACIHTVLYIHTYTHTYIYIHTHSLQGEVATGRALRERDADELEDAKKEIERMTKLLKNRDDRLERLRGEALQACLCVCVYVYICVYKRLEK